MCFERAGNGEYYFPFAEHQRFKFWAYDRLRRHRSLSQARVFMKQYPDETIMRNPFLITFTRAGW